MEVAAAIKNVEPNGYSNISVPMTAIQRIMLGKQSIFFPYFVEVSYNTHLFFALHQYSQLQMAAISRNTASVAQDFHNAGGGKINESQNASNQNIKIESRIQKRSTRYDDTDTNKLAKVAFCNRRRCENVPVYYCESSTIVRQRISPPAKRMAYSNRLTDADTNINEGPWHPTQMDEQTQSNRLASPKNDFEYYIRQMRLNESKAMSNTQSELRKLR